MKELYPFVEGKVGWMDGWGLRLGVEVVRIPHSGEQELRVGRTTIRHTHTIILITLLHSFLSPFLATPLTVSANTVPLNFGLSLETGESKTLAMSSSLRFIFLGAKSFGDNLTLGGGVGGSGSALAE
jgi:hypothetical protein